MAGGGLVERATAGDKVAFELLLEPLVHPAYRLALGMLHDHEAAQDAVQDASVAAWRSLRNLKAGSEMRPWFLAIVANRCRKLRRSRWAAVLRLGEDVAQTGDAEDSVLAGADLLRALRRLSHEERAAVVLYYYLDLPVSEVAAAAGISEAAARKRVQRAVGRLRTAIGLTEVLV